MVNLWFIIGITIYLVGGDWNMAGLWLSHHIGNVTIPTDELHHFSEGWLNHQPDDLGGFSWIFCKKSRDCWKGGKLKKPCLKCGFRPGKSADKQLGDSRNNGRMKVTKHLELRDGTVCSKWSSVLIWCVCIYIHICVYIYIYIHMWTAMQIHSHTLTKNHILYTYREPSYFHISLAHSATGGPHFPRRHQDPGHGIVAVAQFPMWNLLGTS